MNTLLMCHFSELHVRDECGTSRLFVSYIFVLRYFLIIFKSISLFHHFKPNYCSLHTVCRQLTSSHCHLLRPWLLQIQAPYDDQYYERNHRLSPLPNQTKYFQ